MDGVDRHAVIAAALSNRVSSDFSVRRRIDLRQYVLVLKIDEDSFCNRVVANIPGLAIEMERLDDALLRCIHDGFGPSALVRDVDLVEWSRIRKAIRLGFGRQLLS